MLRVVESAHKSDTGRQREANEDAMFSRAPVFAVADGMGGAQAGEVASGMAVQAFEADREEGLPPEEYLRTTIRRANREIYEHAQRDSSRSGMGTTLTAAMIAGEEVSFGHVGDSRAYLLRDGELTQLSNDHSLVEELRRQGKLTLEQASEHPQRSVITRALGPEPDVDVDTMTVRGREGDVFLLCSDGLTTMLSDDEIAEILGRSDDLETACRRLIRAANDRGGKDNITVVAFRTEQLDAGELPDEGPTLLGPTAAEAGLTADAVREGAAARAAPTASTAEPSGRGRGWRRWLLRGALAVLIAAVLATGAVFAARQVWFLGTDEAGRVALFRGLPYELPLGIDLYSEDYSIPITLSALPEERRGVVVEHELRSREDAVDLLDDLQRAAEEQAAAEREQRRQQQRRQREDGGGGGGGSG